MFSSFNLSLIVGEEFPIAWEISMSTSKHYIVVVKSRCVDGFTKYRNIVASPQCRGYFGTQRSIDQVLDTAILDIFGCLTGRRMIQSTGEEGGSHAYSVSKSFSRPNLPQLQNSRWPKSGERPSERSCSRWRPNTKNWIHASIIRMHCTLDC